MYYSLHIYHLKIVLNYSTLSKGSSDRHLDLFVSKYDAPSHLLFTISQIDVYLWVFFRSYFILHNTYYNYINTCREVLSQ